MEKNSEICGKFIRTKLGNFLCCLEVIEKLFFFYMDKNGLRLPSVHELTRGNYLTKQEWDNAIKKWDDPTVYELTGKDLENAKRLAPEIAKDFTFLMSPVQVSKLPVSHARNFK